VGEGRESAGGVPGPKGNDDGTSAVEEDDLWVAVESARRARLGPSRERHYVRTGTGRCELLAYGHLEFFGLACRVPDCAETVHGENAFCSYLWRAQAENQRTKDA
jgi:hypothetical protein